MDFSFLRSPKRPKFSARPKPRKAEEIGLQYNKEAINVGHKARQIVELKERIITLEAEILDHVKQMRAAQFEAAALPPTSAAPTQETSESKGDAK